MKARESELFLNPWTSPLVITAAFVTTTSPLPPGAPLQRSVCQIPTLRSLPEHPDRTGPRGAAQSPQSAQRWELDLFLRRFNTSFSVGEKKNNYKLGLRNVSKYVEGEMLIENQMYVACFLHMVSLSLIVCCSWCVWVFSHAGWQRERGGGGGEQLRRAGRWHAIPPARGGAVCAQRGEGLSV